MDYVVFGIGFGATILVLGLLLRDLGPRLRYRRRANGDGVLPADVLVAKVAWDRFCNAFGAVLAIGGILFLLATFVCIFLMLSNDTGGWVMLVSLAVFFLLILYWTWAFFDRFGAYGILPERPVREEEAEPVPERRPVHRPVTAIAASSGTTTPTEDEETPERAATVMIGPTLDEATTEAADGESAESDEPTGEEGAEAPAVEPESASEAEESSETEADADEGRTITPEERLARMEEPIDHGSAAGDLESEPGVARPPSTRGRRIESPGEPQEAVEAPADGEEGDDAESEPGEPAGDAESEETAERGEEDGTESR